MSKRQGYTPLHFAAISPNPGAVMCIKILCKFGAKVDHLGDKRYFFLFKGLFTRSAFCPVIAPKNNAA